MGKKRCISEAQVQAAFNLAMENGSHEWCDNYDNAIKYEHGTRKDGFHFFTIDKNGSHGYLELNTFGELFLRSITGDKCKLCYWDKSKHTTVYSEWHEVALVNNPNHSLYGALVRRKDGYIIADGTKLF